MVAWTKEIMSPQVIEYWNHCNKLTYIEGLILKGQKILIPKVIQTQMVLGLRDVDGERFHGVFV